MALPGQQLAAVVVEAAAVAHMYPRRLARELPDELIEEQVVGDELEPLPAGLGIGQPDVGGLAGAVLRVGGSAYGLVELTAAVAARYLDGLKGILPQWLEHLLAEALQVRHCVVGRGVVQAQARRGL